MTAYAAVKLHPLQADILAVLYGCEVVHRLAYADEFQSYLRMNGLENTQ